METNCFISMRNLVSQCVELMSHVHILSLTGGSTVCRSPPYSIVRTGVRRETDAVGEKNGGGIIRRPRLGNVCFLAKNYEG